MIHKEFPMSVLDRAALEDSPLADLHAIASELSIDGYRRLRKAALGDAILERAGGRAGREGGAAPRAAPPAPPGPPGGGRAAAARGGGARGGGRRRWRRGDEA